MSDQAPRFELSRVFDDGSREVEIVSVAALPHDLKMGRRGFLGTGATAAGVLGFMTSGCAHMPDGLVPDFLKGSKPASPKPKPHAPAARTDQAAKPSSLPAPRPEPACGGALAHRGEIKALAYAPDGSLLLSGGNDGLVKIWEPANGRLTTTLKGHGAGITALAVSPDGTTLASGSQDQSIRLWALPEGRFLRVLRGHRQAITGLAFSGDGERLVSTATERQLRVWNVADASQAIAVDAHAVPVRALVSDPAGEIVITAGDEGAIKLWEIGQREPSRVIVAKGAAVRALAVSPDAQRLAAAAADGAISIHGLSAEGGAVRLGARVNSPRSLAFSADGGVLLAGAWDGSIRAWSTDKWELIDIVVARGAAVTQVAFDPAGESFAVANDAGRLSLWKGADRSFRTCLIDLAATPSSAKGATYSERNELGQVITYTLPCGSPIPAGATCTCNCVPGSYSVPSGGGTYRGGGTYCSCDKVCTCVPVRICQAHKLLDPDPVVRRMAEQLLLVMGEHGAAYMRWAASTAKRQLAARIRAVLTRVLSGETADAATWPSTDALTARLEHQDRVVRLMAAQLLCRTAGFRFRTSSDALSAKLQALLRWGRVEERRLQRITSNWQDTTPEVAAATARRRW